MIGHQRDVLAALGIDIWIPKAEVCQPHQSTLWRDQAPAEIISDTVSEIIVPHLVARSSVVISPSPVLVPAQQEAVVVAEPVKQAPEPEIDVRPSLNIDAFVVEALNMAHCVVLTDAANLTAEQQLLWSNIQRALASEFLMLQWPFAWLKFQDGRGASSYVQGFIDGMCEGHKSILCLGKIPYLESSECIELASLQEMLDEPKLKKRLWQFMQSKPKDLESS